MKRELTTTPKRRFVYSIKTSRNLLLFYQKPQTIYQYLFLWVAFAIDCNMKWSVDVMAASEILLSDLIRRSRSIIKYTVLHLWTFTDKQACFSITFSIKWITIFMIFAGKFYHYVRLGIHDLCKRQVSDVTPHSKGVC